MTTLYPYTIDGPAPVADASRGGGLTTRPISALSAAGATFRRAAAGARAASARGGRGSSPAGHESSLPWAGQGGEVVEVGHELCLLLYTYG